MMKIDESDKIDEKSYVSKFGANRLHSINIYDVITILRIYTVPVNLMDTQLTQQSHICYHKYMKHHQHYASVLYVCKLTKYYMYISEYHLQMSGIEKKKELHEDDSTWYMNLTIFELIKYFYQI
ncbi:hypothetical protein LOAG_11555 [Loa loa]|uniref:Uncharacterized protein n=1 Tax=Loa loa TaxID=7209 RepID=A0A1S0TNC5_LOALO|nr:hypothetical protein LOAG_11555 [Loa loa]EFO16948.1 hypothetical protein LOAG_11555 [Loa loa]